MKVATLLITLALAAAGCASHDGYNIRSGASEVELRSTMGQPAMEFRNPDGSRELVYPRGPLGLQTFMADVGSDGRVQGIRQVLEDGVFDGIRPGTTRDEILRLIGPPSDTMTFTRLDQTSWEYRYRDTWGYVAFFSVNFDNNGLVVSKFKRRLERSDGHR